MTHDDAMPATVLISVTTATGDGDRPDPRWHAHAACLPGRRVVAYHVWAPPLPDAERARLAAGPPPVATCDCLICVRRRRGARG